MRTLRTLFPPVIVICLGAALAWQFTRPLPDLPDTRAAQAAPSQSAGAQVTEMEFPVAKAIDYSDALIAVAERPLFSETRRIPELIVEEPVEEVTPVQEQVFEGDPSSQIEPPVPPQFQIRGFVSEAGNTSALIDAPESNQQYWVYNGDEILGWTISEITETAITLQQGEFMHVVEIK